ncbi:hypothetical protein EDD85DRAFT_753343, partial [Armillaria nabsnona]
ASDLESISFMSAVVRDGLRMHPVAHNTSKIACQDDVHPLSKPITASKCEVVHELPIPKGTIFFISSAGYS